MALNLNFGSGNGGSGDIIPLVKYDARAGRLSKRDYVGGEYVVTDITSSFMAVVDFENIETGWLSFATGGAPDMALARFGDPVPAQPSPDHKQGIRMLIQLSSKLDGSIRELAGNSKAMLRGIDAVHTEYLEGVKTNPGKLPVIKLNDTIASTTGEGARKSTNYIPVFEIVKWVDRPEKLIYVPKARAVSSAPAAAPPATGSKAFAAPAPAPALIADDEDDFG